MRILLINPPVPASYYNREYYIPSSLVYLGAVLQKNGEEVKILDLKTLNIIDEDNPDKLYEEVISDAISNFKPELIGFTCLYSGTFPDILKFLILIKERFKEIPIVIGGIHPTIYAKEILTNCPSIDWIILSEGEESIIQLVTTVKSRRYEFDKIDGFAFRHNNKIIVNPKTHYIENLDAIPFPAYNLINLAGYYMDTSLWHNPKKLSFNTSFPIITSRSCPNRCPFCAMFMAMGLKWRARSAQNVVDEIEFVYHEYNQNHFLFMDDNLTLNKKRVLEICNQIKKRNLDIQFETPNGLAVNTLDGEVLDALISAGMVRTWLTIESGSDFIRNKIMRKNLPREKIYQIVKFTKKYKQLNVAAFFIIGMPEETHETLMETYNMIKEIDVHRIFLQNVVPFPGTEVFNQAVRDNLLIDTDIDKLYLYNDRYLTNYDHFFIKPYKLEVADLKKFRLKCEELPSIKRPVERHMKNKERENK